ncbi:hypothetical protein MHYP_G00210740 [Metynnis hypsauchen]
MVTAEQKMGETERRTPAAEQMGERGQWKNKVEFLLAMAGNIVGLGNVWRFPYLCYKNGGGIGHTGCLTALYSCICYNIILAWALFYLISSLSVEIQWNSCANLWNTVNCVELTSNKINWTVNKTQLNFTTSAVTEFWEHRVLAISTGIEVLGNVNWEILLCLLATWIICYFCIWKGVKSTGKAVYFTAVFPYVMMLILLIRSLTLPGAMYGVKYYLYPQPSRLADPQFMSIEVVMSSLSDMFPTLLRRPNRRELFLLFFCTASFCFQILMTTQVTVKGLIQNVLP